MTYQGEEESSERAIHAVQDVVGSADGVDDDAGDAKEEQHETTSQQQTRAQGEVNLKRKNNKMKNNCKS